MLLVGSWFGSGMSHSVSKALLLGVGKGLILVGKVMVQQGSTLEN